MNRKNAIKIILNFFKNSPVVSANGFISRDLFNVSDKKSNFYMIGSMGLASSIALGVAMKNTKKLIFVFDGDGNILMNLGSLTTIGKLQPKNLIHVIFDNSIHESTGGQPTSSSIISIAKIAKSCKYKKIFTSSSKKGILKILDTIKNNQGPIMIIVKIEGGGNSGRRISIPPEKIKDYFIEEL